MKKTIGVLAGVLLMLSVAPSAVADHAASVTGGCQDSNGGVFADSETADVSAGPSGVDAPDVVDVVNTVGNLGEAAAEDPTNPTDVCEDSPSSVGVNSGSTTVACYDGDVVAANTVVVASDDGSASQCQAHDTDNTNCNPVDQTNCLTDN